jgi:hypothetical protein
MSELSMHELAAELGEVLPEREALSVVIGSFNHRTTINHNSNHVTTAVITASNSSTAVSSGIASSATSSAGQSISVHG